MAGPQPGYQRQVGASSTPQPFATPAAFGAAIGEGLHDLGGSIDRIQAREREQDRDNQVADFNVKFAQARTDTDQAELDARTDPNAVPGSHAERVMGGWTARSEALLNGITDPKVKNYAAEALANYSDRLHEQAYSWQKGQEVAKLATDAGQTIDLSANRARRAADPANPAGAKALGEELDQTAAGIAQLSVPADVKDKLLREARQKIVHSYAEGVNDHDPHQLKALIGKGAFDEYLTPEQIDALGSEADVGIRRDEVEARAQLAAEKAQAHEDIGTFKKKLEDHIPVPDADIVRMGQLAAKYGFDGEVYDLGKARVINNANRVYQAATPMQIAQDKAALDAKIAKAGDKAKPEDVILRDHLDGLLASRREQLRNDPLSFAPQLGVKLEPVDLNDPGSIDRRVTAAKALAQTTGAPVQVLTRDEADLLAANAKAGGAGRAQAAEQLARFGPYYGRMAAMQIAPDDEVLQRAVTLPKSVRDLALSGADYRKANPKLVPEREALPEYQAAIGRAIGQLGGEFNAATWETAKNIYAGFAGRNGYASEHLDKAHFRDAVNMALGATKRGGAWQGGIGEWNRRTVLLPTSMTQAEFDGAMANLHRPMQGASNGSPLWADGSPVQAGQLRDQFRPVAVKDGVYRFEDARGNSLRVRGGAEYQLDIRKIAR